MTRRLRDLLSGEQLRARALRGTAFAIVSMSGSHMLRLASNLILTRLLFPEAFGLMALVNVFMTGLQMFSDIGVNTAIIQHRRGDDPLFLNTAWTLQILRGVFLWLCACLLAFPVAAFYDEPMLAQILPVAGLGAVISGFSSTKIATVNRALHLGRLTAIELSSKLVNVILMVLLAWMLQSVWALVLGALFGQLLRSVLSHWALPGHPNRLGWEWVAFHDMFGFGKFIFLSTVAGFLVNQGDRAVLGAYVPLDILGIYTIGYLLGSLPMFLGRTVSAKVIMPLYRARPPTKSAANRARMLRARRLVVFGALLFSMALAHGGIALVDLLYDPRYAIAGPILVLFCLASVPLLASIGYTSALLAHGDSKRSFYDAIVLAATQTTLLVTGVHFVGLPGAVMATGLAMLLTYPLRARYARRYQAWDPVGDIGVFGLGFLVNGAACWIHRDAIATLFAV